MLLDRLVRSALLGAGVSMFALAPMARAADVSLDNIEVKQDKPDEKVVIKHMDVKGSNLSADDLKKLFSRQLTDADAKAMAAKFKADQISVPEVDVTGADGGAVLHNIVASGIDSGRIARFDVAGADVTDKGGGGKVGALHIENLSLARALEAESTKPKLGALGITALKFDGFDVKLLMKDEDNAIAHITMQPIELHATYDADFPTKSDFTFSGITVEFPPDSKPGQQLKAFGVDKVQMAIHAAGTCDKAAKTCNVSDLTFNFADLGAMTLTGNVANVKTDMESTDADSALSAAMQQQIADVQLKLVNAGVFDKAIAAYAKSKGMKPEALKAGLPMMASALPALLGDPTASKKLGEAMTTFLKDPKSLMVSLKAKSAPVAISDLSAVKKPADVFQKFNFDAAANQ